MIFEGSAVAMITPFDEKTCRIDYQQVKNLLDFHLKYKTDALVIMGTTGESSTTTDEEQINMIEFAVKHVNGRRPVIAGTGINDTRHSIHLSQQAESVGADALLVVTPYYNRTSPEGMIKHFTMIADSVNIPIILYHVPGRTAAELTPEQVAELAKHPNIVALKDATGDLDYTKKVLELVPDNFAVYSGNDDINPEMAELGAKGWISVTANVLPEELHDIYDLIKNDKMEEAREIQERIADFTDAMFVEVNPIPIKYQAYKLGLIDSLTYRMPLLAPSEDNQKMIDSFSELVAHYKQ